MRPAAGTPTTVINTNVDVLLANADEPIGAHAKWLGYIKAESGRLAKLTDDLLSLTRMDRGDDRRFREKLDLGDTVTNVVLTMEAVFFEKGIALRHAVTTTVFRSRETAGSSRSS